MSKAKLKILTSSLAGCFGCHMSLLDMDERWLELADLVELVRSPLVDTRSQSRCDIGLIEGGLCNEENIHLLLEFREQCKILVAVGACAINGGVPALRNRYSVADCLEAVYLHGLNVTQPQIPSDAELPLLTDKVYPLQEWVKVDYSLPGCPPPADAFFQLISALHDGREPDLNYVNRHFD
ncbi:MAG TPA: NADP oxidoreductase [Gammaproteobacteria bacterium]|nr:NADP oxidoreductase [Gammaproteobacteria bacterium]